jgi:virulence factor Mce-like protein
MIKKALTPTQALAITLFVLSCFAVLLYLWITFGGSSPLKPKGYQIEARFPEATLLAQEADVRISGVPVGRVVKLERDGNRTRATLEIDSKYAPIPRDTRALLRLKTLFGETYVELTPGTRSAGPVPDGASLPDSAVAPSVELDEVLRTFQPRTRAAFRTWLQAQASATDGRGADISAALGSLPGFVDSADGLLATLDSQSSAVRRLVSSTGDFFGAISEREGELRGLITDANRLFQTTAARNADLASVFRELPRFEREATLTLPQLSAFARRARPVVKRLQPAATQADPLFADVARLSPQFDGFFARLNEVVAASKPGLPAFDRILADVPGLLDSFQPFLRNANPVLDYIGMNKREVTALFANVAAASQIHDQKNERTTNEVHFLRTAQTLGPTAMSFYPRPLGSTRLNPYVAPGGMATLATGLPVLDKSYCGNLDPLPPASPAPGSLSELVATYGIRTTGRDAARPPCVQQGPFAGFGTQFPHLTAEP